MPHPDTPRWKRSNLDTHYKKRVGKDDKCWRDILDIARPMTEIEYEQESYNAYEKAVLEYKAEELDNPLRINRVDKRTVKTITDLGRNTMITCYHEHYDRPHVKGSAGEPLLQNTLRFLRSLDNRAAGKVIKLQRLELVKNNIRNNPRKRNGPLVKITETICKDRILK